ncbi:MAG: argininosuccinate synthase [Candidatus Micrarchaeota archaeon]
MSLDLLDKVKKKVGDEYKDINRVVLAFSGGLDTTVIASLLLELGKEVITCTLDLGQEGELKKITEKSKRIGIKKHYFIDAKKEFVREYIWPAIKANAMYEGSYPLFTALGRPLIAKKLAEIGKKENADAVCHGSTGKGNDQVRIDAGVIALSPMKVVAPVRDWGLTRDVEIEYALNRKLDVKITKDKPYSIDENLWGRSIEAGPIENPEQVVPEDAYEWTKPVEQAPSQSEIAEIFFESGVPKEIEIDGTTYKDEIEMIKRLSAVAGAHGIGRIEHMEDRTMGFKSREVYETPAAFIVLPAHKDLEKYILTKDEIFHKAYLDNLYSTLVYEGKWYSPLRVALDKFNQEVETNVTGSVKIKLYKGGASTISRKSKNALYDFNIATYNKGSSFNQKEGGIFTKIWLMQYSTAYKMKYDLK